MTAEMCSWLQNHLNCLEASEEKLKNTDGR